MSTALKEAVVVVPFTSIRPTTAPSKQLRNETDLLISRRELALIPRNKNVMTHPTGYS
jgi:hypothetical protein